MKEIKRGEIYYIRKTGQEIGSEQHGGRPAVVVSAPGLAATSPVLMVVYLTTKPKRNLPTHVLVEASGRPSVALCEQVSAASINRFGDYIGRCSLEEIEQIDRALAHGLDLDYLVKEEDA